MHVWRSKLEDYGKPVCASAHVFIFSNMYLGTYSLLVTLTSGNSKSSKVSSFYVRSRTRSMLQIYIEPIYIGWFQPWNFSNIPRFPRLKLLSFSNLQMLEKHIQHWSSLCCIQMWRITVYSILRRDNGPKIGIILVPRYQSSNVNNGILWRTRTLQSAQVVFNVL